MEPADVRALFPITSTRAYLFAGGLAPVSTRARAAMDEWVDRWMFDPCFHRADYFADWRALKERFARIVGADIDEVALTDGTSRGNNLAVQMIDAPPGSNVVLDATTYPSALYPWLVPAKRHVEIRRVPTRGGLPVLEELADLVDKRTVAITVSHVCRTTGFRHQLGELGALAREHGAHLVVDAAQSAGAVEIDVARDGIDFLACGAMKWLLGAPGVGFFYVRHDLAEAIPPPHVGPLGTKQAAGELSLAAGAGRHELNTGDFAGMAASRTGLEILLSVGMDIVERHVLELSERLVRGLLQRGIEVVTPLDPTHRAGIVNFAAERPEDLRLFLRQRGVDVWGYDAEQRMRADPHVYNDEQDVDRLLDGIDDFVRAHGAEAVVPTRIDAA
jgi:selenocysteine lyase/cysteine desulfurase